MPPPLLSRRHAPLLYQVTVNNRLEVTVDPREMSRGQSAFQTDLCVFEDVEEGDQDSASGNGVQVPHHDA